jgi:hypothetical protein
MERLSKPSTKAGRLQRACLDLLYEHEADGAIPTSIRFLFYELLDRGLVPNVYRDEDGVAKKRMPSQYVSEAVHHLRKLGVPWEWIVDETRTVYRGRYAASVLEYLEDTVPLARIDVWAGEKAPLILCESRSLAGVLRTVADDYLCPIASTNGQVGGFLHTDIAPLVKGGRRVLYLGDYDLSGSQIEENTRKVLRSYGDLHWERVAITDVQVRELGLPAIPTKIDRRYNPPRESYAVETEALGQTRITELLTERLEEAVPELLAVVLAREQKQRVQVQVRERLSADE